MQVHRGSSCAVLLAAGAGRRMGRDKALLELGGRPLVARAVLDLLTGGVEHVIVVRARGAAPLPLPADRRVCVTEIEPGLEMIDSLRAGLAERPAGAAAFLVLPVDHALAGAEVVALLLAHLPRERPAIALPLCERRPGHPIAFSAPVLAEILDPATTSLRDVIRRDPDRNLTVPVTNPWVVRDLDTVEDLAAAQAWLRARPLPAPLLMREHRSRRAYRPDPIPEEQLAWLVDCARHASTSSLIQAYAMVAVRDPERRREVARLCADQEHIRQAPVFLAICADLHKLERACARHGRGLDASPMELFLQATIDAALVGQNLQLAAEAEGLGACMIGAARNHPVELARLLGLPPRVFVVYGMTMGRPADDPVPRGRMPLGGVLHFEHYDPAQVDAALAGADDVVRAWARRVNAEQGGFQGKPVHEGRGWTDRIAHLFGGGDHAKTRRHLVPELRRLGFGLE